MEYHSKISLDGTIATLFIFCVVYMKLSRCSLLLPCGSKGRNTLQNQWFKWGQLYSFCHQYDDATKGVKSTFGHGCITSNCKECISVCHKNMSKKSLTDCENSCHSKECKRGCQFYAHIFNRNVGNFSSDLRNLPNIKSNIIQEEKGMTKVNFSWIPIYSNGIRRLSSIYLVTIQANTTHKYSDKYEYALGLVQAAEYSIHMIDMCKYMFSGYRYKRTTKIAMKVYPINFNGPTKEAHARKMNLVLRSEYTSPIETLPVINVTVGSPIFIQNMYVMWRINWLQPIDFRSNGVKYFYNIYSCNNAKTLEEMKQLQGRVANLRDIEGETMFNILHLKIYDNVYDELSSCKIIVDFRTKYGACFLGKPTYTMIEYPGCKKVANYTNQCPPLPRPVDTFIYEVNATVIGYTCEHYVVQHCPIVTTFNCSYCNMPKYNISLNWNALDISYPVHSYTLRWGKRKNIIRARKISVSTNTTSYVITTDIITTNYYNFCVQVHAETKHSFKEWIYMKDALLQVELKYPKPILIKTSTKPSLKPMTKVNNKIILIVLTVLLFIVVIIIIIKLYVYKEKRQREKYSKIQEIPMSTKSESIADDWEIYPSNIMISEQIGEGAFGSVYRATIKTSILTTSKYAKQCGGENLVKDDNKPIAVKFLKEGANDREYKDFEEEISLMKLLGYHKHIVNIVGCSTIKQPLCLLLEYMQHGDLLSFMRKHRAEEINSRPDISIGQCNEKQNSLLSPEIMMSFAWQIASGMEYIATNNVVHRDLAARNVLVGSNNNVKISDFGFSRHVSNELIYTSSNTTRKLPMKWMSIEAIYHQEFTVASDVWAYGIVLFEIVTLGGTPYPSIDNLLLCEMLKSGYRMDKPENCGDEIYNIMLHCWNEITLLRPTFTELREHLEKTIEACHYFNFNINENNIYYNVASFKSVQRNDEEENLFTREYNGKPVQVKSMDRVNYSMDDIGVLKAEVLNNGNKKRNQYYSPQSIKSFTVIEKWASFDNPNLLINSVE